MGKLAFLPPLAKVVPRYPGITLTWRVAGVALAFATGLGLNTAGFGEQLGFAIHYLAAIVISLLISHAGTLLAVNAGLAIAWLMLPYRFAVWPAWAHRIEPGYAWFYDILTLLNRQLGHLECAVLWILAWLAHVEGLPWQLGGVAVMLLFAEPILDTAAVFFVNFEDREIGARERKDHPSLRVAGSIHWARRPLINVATFVGAWFVYALAPDQIDKSAGLLIAMVAGALLRLMKWTLRHVQYRRDARKGDSHLDNRRESFRQTHVKRWGRADTPLLLVAAPLLLGWAYSFQQTQRSEAAQEQRDRNWSDRAVACMADPSSSMRRSDISVFVLADSQFHDLKGARFAGEMAFADALVPVAQRPVELQILAQGTLLHLAEVRDLATASPETKLPWVYLGDFADLGCVHEMERILATLAAFDLGRVLGTAPGNHDSSFTGNFAWSPHWDHVCANRLDKQRSDALLVEAFGEGIEHNKGRLTPVWGEAGWRSWSRGFQRGQALVAVTPLGVSHVRGKARGVVGVFLDTSDQIDFDLGVAGMVGTLSGAQVDTLIMLASEVTRSAPYTDPVYVLFSHHPIRALNEAARARLAELVLALDDTQVRVVGFVSAHTHRAQKHANLCVGGRLLDDLVVGSTIDAPQEAALLEIGTDEAGDFMLSVTTVPAVSRPGMTCMAAFSPTSMACQRLVNRWGAQEDCEDLLRREDGAVGEDCASMESQSAIGDRLAGIQSAPDGDALRESQRIRANQLFACLCRDDRCTPPEDPMDDDQVARVIQRASEQPGGKVELACMGWAAAAVSAHGANGMEMADALRCAFDDLSIQPARRMTTRLGVRACH
ncbi:MAG: hypothetical protein V3V08_14970 [Nannocystaceae bacterium]